MKLNKRQRKILQDWEVPNKDVPQIEEAIGVTKFTLQLENGRDKRITIKQAMNVLGEQEFLLGMVRSAFHWSTSRTNIKGQTVSFDSSRLFKN